MDNYKSLLKSDPTSWLLEESNPHVRYFALRWLFDESEHSKPVVKTKEAIARSAPVLKLTERQRPSGGWGADPRSHHSTRGPFGYPLHYTSDILEVLELVAPYVHPNDDRIQQALGIVLKKQDKRGRWACEKHLRAAKWIEQYLPPEEIGEPSKWVTLHAMWMLKTLYTDKRFTR
jgi:hypothetical protein